MHQRRLEILETKFFFNEELNLNSQVNNISKSGFVHISNILAIRNTFNTNNNYAPLNSSMCICNIFMVIYCYMVSLKPKYINVSWFRMQQPG